MDHPRFRDSKVWCTQNIFLYIFTNLLLILKPSPFEFLFDLMPSCTDLNLPRLKRIWIFPWIDRKIVHYFPVNSKLNINQSNENPFIFLESYSTAASAESIDCIAYRNKNTSFISFLLFLFLNHTNNIPENFSEIIIATNETSQQSCCRCNNRLNIDSTRLSCLKNRLNNIWNQIQFFWLHSFQHWIKEWKILLRIN